MPGLTGNVHHGARRHIRAVRETAFGQVPGGPSWTVIPILGDGAKLKATSDPFEPDTNFGGFVDTQIKIQHKLEPQGDLTTLLWPQIAGFLLDWALERNAAEGDDLYSYALDHYTPADPRRYRGVVASGLRIAVTGTGDADAQITLTLRGQDEAENNTLVAGDFDYTGIDLVPFMHSHSTVWVNAAEAFDVEAWTLTVENELAVGPFIRKAGINRAVVGYLIGGRRTISLDLTRVNRTELFNDAIRGDVSSISFEAQFVHPEGHLLQIQLPTLIVPSSDEDGTPSQVAKESPRLLAIANAGGTALCYAVDLGPTTTTLEPLTTTPAATTTTEEATTTTTAP